MTDVTKFPFIAPVLKNHNSIRIQCYLITIPMSIIWLLCQQGANIVMISFCDEIYIFLP